MFNHIIDPNILLVPQKRVAIAVSNAFGPFGWTQHRKLFKGNVFEEIINNPVTIITEPFVALNREVIQPLYREVIQPVGHALEKIGQGIAKDPLTFIAQAAAVAAAPFTGGMSLWALPVIAAASTAAKGGSFEQILTATAISAATAAVGGGFGLENSVGGLIMNGLSTATEVGAGFAIAGQSISYGTANAIATAGQGLAMGAVAATGAAVQGKDPFQAALPSLVGTALGFAGNQLAQADFFKPITSTLNEISTNVSPIVSKAMTGVASAMITGAVTGKDMTQVAIASLANTAVSGLVSASNFVADFFRNDAGGITNMGAATQSIVADLLGSTAATLASGGKMGPEMGAQFLANATRTLVPFLDPKFDALATNVQLTYKDAEAKVKAVNDAANNQQGLVDKYNKDADTLNSIANEVNSLLAQRDSVYNRYQSAGTQAEINDLKAQFQSLESQISAKTSQYNALYNTIDDTNAAYLQSVKDTEAAQKAYFEVSKALGTLGTQLSEKMNEASKALTTVAAKQIDPNFNAEEYKAINNLGSGVDAAVHYISVGKDQGLPTNQAAAQTYVDEQKERLIGDIIKQQGYSSIMYVPKDVYAKLRTLVDTQYGNNLGQLKDATPTNITQWGTYSLGKTIGDYLPKFDAAKAEAAAYERMADIVITPSWYNEQAHKDYSLPTGMMYANQNDIMNGTAKSVTTKNGYTVWVKPTSYSATVSVYDSATGNIISKPASDVLGTKTFEQMSAAEKIAFLNSIEKATLTTENKAKLVEQAGASAIEDAKRVVNTIQGSSLSDDAKNVVSSVVAGIGNVPGMFGTALKYIGYYADIESMENKGAELSAWSDSFSDLVKASRSADAKASAENIQLINNKTKGFLDSVSGWAEIIKTEGKEVLSGMLAEEFGEEAAQKTGSLSAMAATWASTAAMGIEIGAKKLVGIGVAVDAATSMIESFDGTAKSTEKRLYDAYIAQGMSRELAASKAKDDSLAPALFSALVTGAAEGVAGKTLVDAVFGTTLDKTAMALAQRFMSAEAVNILADLSEGGLQGLAEELAVWKVDPNAADIAGGATKGALWEATLGRGMGTTVAGAGLMINLAYAANPAFEAALKSGNYTMGELGTVLNEWTPPASTALSGAADIRTILLPQIFETAPQYAAGYTSVGNFIDAVKNATGVWEAQVLTDVASNVDNGKFAPQITAATDKLKNSGLANITAEDLISSGALKSTAKSTSQALADAYNAKYPDVAKWAATQPDPIEATLNHWWRAGKAEGRTDPWELATGFNRAQLSAAYSAANPDVARWAATMPDPAQSALDHWLAYGQNENRVDPAKLASDQAAASYADKNMVTWAELKPSALAEGAVPTAENAALLASATAVENLYTSLLGRPSDAEGKDYWVDQLNKYGPGYIPSIIASFVGSLEYKNKNGTASASVSKEASAKFKTDLVTSLYENILGRAPDAAGLKAWTNALIPTATVAGIANQFVASTEFDEKYAKQFADLIGRGVQTDVIAQFIKDIDPKAVTTAEATKYFTDLGYTKATAQVIAQFVKAAPEADMQAAVASYVDPRMVTRSEAIKFYNDLGYKPTEAEIVKYIVQGPEVVQADIQKQLGAYVDPRMVDEQEVRDIFKTMGLTVPVADADIKRLTGQYSESLLAGKAKEALPVVSANAVYAMITSGISQGTSADVKKQIEDSSAAVMAKLADYQKAGMDADAALNKALSEVATSLGTTKTELLAKIGTTEAKLQTQISSVQAALTSRIDSVQATLAQQMVEYQKAGLDADEALQKAITSVSDQLGVTESNLMLVIGKTQDQLQSDINAVATKIDSVQTAVMDKMAAYEQSGIDRDTALSKAITDVAGNLNTTKDTLLKQLGQTEAEFGKKIADVQTALDTKISSTETAILTKMKSYEDAGLARDVAQDKALADVSAQLGIAKTDLINRLGATEASITEKLSTAQVAFNTKLDAIQSNVMAKMSQYQSEGLAADAALQKAISTVASDLGTTKADMLAEINKTEADLTDAINTKVAATERTLLTKMEQYEAQGLTRDQAIQKSVETLSGNLGTTKSELLARIGTSEANLGAKITALQSQEQQNYADISQKMQANLDAGMASDAALNDAIASVATKLGVTESNLMAGLGKTQAQLQTSIDALSGKLSAVESVILDKVSQYEAAGLTRDQAIQKSVDSVATQLGTTKSDLLSRIGATENTLVTKINDVQAKNSAQITDVSNRLSAQIAANEDAGMARDAAINSAVNKVASDLGTTRTDLLAQIGATESTLTKSVSDLQTKTQTQITNLQAAIEDQMKSNMAAGMASDAALQSAIDKVAGSLNTTTADILGKLGTTQQQLSTQITTGLQEAARFTQERITAATTELKAQMLAYEQAGMDRDTAAQLAISTVAQDLGTTKAEFLSQLGTTESNLTNLIQASAQQGQAYTQQQVQAATDTLTKQIDAYRKAGMDANAATNEAVANLSNQLGVSVDSLMANLGTSVSQLQSQISAQAQASQQYTQQQVQQATKQLQDQMAAYEQAGLDRDTATQLSIANLSQDLGLTKDELLARMGSSEATLTQLIQSASQAGQAYTQQQIQALNDQLTTLINANQQAGMDANAATNKAIQDLAGQLGTTANTLLTQMGTNQAALQAQIEAASQAGQQYTQQQVQAATSAIQQQMQANMQAGMDADAALQKAINDVATQSNTNATNLLAQLGKTEATLRQEMTTGLSNVQQQIQAQMAQYEAAGLSRDQALQRAISDVSAQLGTTSTNLLAQLGTTQQQLSDQIAASQQASQQYTQQQVQQSQQAIMDKMAQYEANGLSRDQALQRAISDVSAQLGTTSANLLAQMGTNQQQLLEQLSTSQTQTQQQIASTKKEILDQMTAYEQAGLDRDTALSLAITGVSQQLGTTKTDLLTKLGTTEANLRTEFTAQNQQLSQQVQDVSKLLGKPASQVTAADIQAVQSMLGGTTATNLSYDVNQDGKVDSTDLTLIKQQQQIEQNTGITQQVDPNTGLTVYIDTATGQPITGFSPAAGSPWAATGIYSVLDQQKAQAAATAKAQAASAKQAQQKNNFSQMMQMVLGAPDAAGQKVEVKTPDPARINYMYDWSSIFATPQQAGLMPSPYGAMNTYGQPTQGQGGLGSLQTGFGGQAANQSQYKMAIGGYAEGGMINNDISVGDGGSVDDLLNILKGNSG